MKRHNAISMKGEALGATRMRGFSLVELMVSITLGLVILAGVLAIFGQTVRGNKVNLEAARLNQDLSSAMQIMVNDIMRSGHTNGAPITTADVTTTGVFETQQDILIPTASSDLPTGVSAGECLLYAYDDGIDNTGVSPARVGCDPTPAGLSTWSTDPPPCIEPNREIHGFRLVDGALEMRRTATAFATGLTSCTHGTWEQVTDPNVVTVTALAFTTTQSKCKNTPTAVTGLQSYWVTTATTGNDALAFPCGATTGVTQFLYNAGTNAFAQNTGAFVPPVTGDRLAESRQVNITLTGEVTGDATVTKTLEASVKLRNDRLRVF